MSGSGSGPQRSGGGGGGGGLTWLLAGSLTTTDLSYMDLDLYNAYAFTLHRRKYIDF